MAVAVVLVGALLGTAAVWTNTFEAGNHLEGLLTRMRLAIDPPPDRPTRPTVTVTEPPELTPAPTPYVSLAPDATPIPTPTPTTAPVRAPVDVNLLRNPKAFFVTELTKDWCAPAGVQITLAILGKADTSEHFQRTLVSRVNDWEAWSDSHNGDWGPAAMVQALEAYGAPGYEIRAYETRTRALHDAAAALSRTHAPVLLLAWRGAHTWVMTGYRATADPTIFGDARVTGTYILDPWYPRVSTIWGASDPPGTFQDDAEMKRNFLPWKRPEGAYPERDGKFIVLIPSVPVSPPAG